MVGKDEIQGACEALEALTGGLHWRLSSDGENVTWDGSGQIELTESQAYRLIALRYPPLSLIEKFEENRDGSPAVNKVNIPIEWFTPSNLLSLNWAASADEKRREDGARVAQLLSRLTELPWKWDGNNVRTVRLTSENAKSFQSLSPQSLNRQAGIELILPLAVPHLFVTEYDMGKLERAVERKYLVHPQTSNGYSSLITTALEALTGIGWHIQGNQLIGEFQDERAFTVPEILRIQHLCELAAMPLPFMPLIDGQVRRAQFDAGIRSDVLATKLNALAKAESLRRANAPDARPELEKLTGTRWVWDGLNLRSAGSYRNNKNPKFAEAEGKLADLNIPRHFAATGHYLVPRGIRENICLIDDIDRPKLSEITRRIEAEREPNWLDRLRGRGRNRGQER